MISIFMVQKILNNKVTQIDICNEQTRFVRSDDEFGTFVTYYDDEVV